MGQFRFHAPPDDHMPPDAFASAYLAGMEGIPWPSTTRREPTDNSAEELILERSVGESGNLFIPWRVEGHGELMLSTASLMERDDTKASITVDGHAVGEIRPGDQLTILTSEKRVTLIHPPGFDFYGILRSKLYWGRDSRKRDE